MVFDHTVISNPTELQSLTHVELPKDQPTIYLCLEGPEFDPDDAPVLLSILVNCPAGKRHCYYVQIRVLPYTVFEIRGSDQLALHDILQRSDIPKVVFNVVNTARTLYLRYGISLRGVLDLQLMGEITRRFGNGTYPHHAGDLISCIEQDLCEFPNAIRLLRQGRSLNNPYEALVRSPLSDEARRYAYAGVGGLPILSLVYLERLRRLCKQDTLAMETRGRMMAAEDNRPEAEDRSVDYPLLYETDLPERIHYLLRG